MKERRLSFFHVAFFIEFLGGIDIFYEVVVIGAGVTGTFLARELSRYALNVCILEKEADVAMGTSKANSAIVHAGYDAKPGSLKAKLNVQGNNLMDQAAAELSVPFKRIGSLVLAFNEGDMGEIRKLYEKGLQNGVYGIKVINREEIKRIEPNISDVVLGGLYAPTCGVICPYELTIGAMENAVANGAQLKLECVVERINIQENIFVISTSRGEIKCKYLINAAGVFADKISAMAGEDFFSIHPRRGEYLILDRNQGTVVNTVIFQPPSKMGKGILVTPTIHGNLLLGPTAEDIESREDVSTTGEGLEKVILGSKKSVPSIDIRQVITSFAGLRAAASTGDFIIEASDKVKGFINVAGIESPGLTSAPAAAKYVIDILKDLGVMMIEKKNYNPIRKPVKRFREMSDEERNALIKKDPRYGKIICRCETVTEGEIVDCISRPAGAANLDAVKRRTRAGTGRCQGGFCSPRVVDILSRELGLPVDEITKMGGKSKILAGKTK